MGAMSQIAAEKEESLQAARCEYQEAFTAYQRYREEHPPAHRKPDEQTELNRLESICMSAKRRYDGEKSRRYIL